MMPNSNTLHYFGTGLNCAGHGFYECHENYLGVSKFRYSDFSVDYFCPETIADSKKGKKNGDVFYFRVGKYAICYIEGSCSDTRGGSKSVFFTEDKIKLGEMPLKILSIPVCRKIIKQMPFKVRWGGTEEIIKKIDIFIKENN